MLPLQIGACLRASQVEEYRAWLFDDERDLELQDFMACEVLTGDWRSVADSVKKTLDGFKGRLGIHGPYEGLDLDNKDAEIRPIITDRFLTALDAAEAVGAQQMVLHSPYRKWYQNNILNHPHYREEKLDRIHSIMDPVVQRAEETGIVLVIENIEDVDPATRRVMVDSFDSDAIALSIDTGHAHLARRGSGAPPVDYFVRDAGNQLAHVHIQDLDGHADRHWAPGEGEIEWPAVFRALADCESKPHLVLELCDKAHIQQGFKYLKDLGLAC